MPNVIIKTPEEIDEMRRACRLAAKTLEEAAALIRPGISTLEIDTFVHNYTIKHHAIPAPLNYQGFPKSCCTSINNVICHGIPKKGDVLKDGDIINVDITSILNGWHGDVSATFYVGTPSEEVVNLVETTRRSLEIGISEVRPDARMGDIGAAIQEFVEGRGFSVVRDYCGHGVGRQFHESLLVEHVGRRGRGLRLKPGMTFTIEPMVNTGSYRTRTLDDGWTAVTVDGGLSAQFEHTLVVTDEGCEVLTAFEAPLRNSITPTWFKF